MRLRNRVFEIRKALGLSQHQLSRLTGLSRMTIRAIERDMGHEASTDTQRKLCAALNRTDLFWMEREDTDPAAPADERTLR